MTHHSMHMSTPTDPYICKDRQFLRTNPPCMQTTSLPLSNTILSRLPLHCHVLPFLVSAFRQSQVTVHLFNMAAAEHMTYQLARLIVEVSMRRRWRREEYIEKQITKVNMNIRLNFSSFLFFIFTNFVCSYFEQMIIRMDYAIVE